MASDLFKKIDNAVLDLQASQPQTYEGLLSKLAQLLRHPDLEPYNQKLIDGVDLESFLNKEGDDSSFHDRSLRWTGDDNYDLGLKYLLIQKFADGRYASSFCHTYFDSPDRKIISSIHNMVRGLIIPFIRDYKDYIAVQGQTEVKLNIPPTPANNNRIFIVHGHDELSKEKIARFLEQNGFEPIILHEQASGNKTIIEKIEKYADVGFAVVLLTPDDLGKAKDAESLEPRARQNVILELGYFMGKLGRDRVCAFNTGGLEIPSDFQGIVWNPLDNTGAWKQFLAKELTEAGYELDIKRMLLSLG